MIEKKIIKKCEGKCSTLYCSECANLNYNRKDGSYYWCEYWQMFTRKPENIACDYFERR